VLGRKPCALTLPHSAASVATITGSGLTLRAETERFEVGVPGVVTGKAAVGMLNQASDHMGGQCTFAHVGERLGVDDVIIVACAQQREEYGGPGT
jgi:hypothetical protein